jgi:hypothetical protein
VRPDVVTMYSQVLLQDTRSGQRNTLTLCYPADAEPAVGFVSVLSPVGSALLGLRVGSTRREHPASCQRDGARLIFSGGRCPGESQAVARIHYSDTPNFADLGGAVRLSIFP